MLAITFTGKIYLEKKIDKIKSKLVMVYKRSKQ